jgi:RimJ/RimL family protein N-acetyltransferase
MATLEVTAADVPADWRARLPRLGTDRVVLRELQPTDAPALYGLVCHSNVVREMWPPPASVEGFEQFIEWTWRERVAGRFDQNLWAIVAGFDETSPSASDAKRSDTHPRAS